MVVFKVSVLIAGSHEIQALDSTMRKAWSRCAVNLEFDEFPRVLGVYLAARKQIAGYMHVEYAEAWNDERTVQVAIWRGEAE